MPTGALLVDNAALVTIVVPQQAGQWDKVVHTLAGDLAHFFADWPEHRDRNADRFLLLPLLGLYTCYALGPELEPEIA
jgi:hypothetical protein